MICVTSVYIPSVSSNKPSISKITALIGPNAFNGAFIASDPFIKIHPGGGSGTASVLID
jgi:hypothetical protein